MNLFSTIISAIAAGGIAGQLSVLIWGNQLIKKREFEKWLREEKFKLFSEFLSSISSAASRDEFASWPDEIRVISQRIHLLYPEGIAPEKQANHMENLFQFSLKKKLGKIKDEIEWRRLIREESQKLRKEFAKDIHNI